MSIIFEKDRTVAENCGLSTLSVSQGGYFSHDLQFAQLLSAVIVYNFKAFRGVTILNHLP